MNKLLLVASATILLGGTAFAQSTSSPPRSAAAPAGGEYGPMAYPDWQARWRAAPDQMGMAALRQPDAVPQTPAAAGRPATAPAIDVSDGTFRSNIHTEFGPQSDPDWQAKWRALQTPGGLATRRPAPAAAATHG